MGEVHQTVQLLHLMVWIQWTPSCRSGKWRSGVQSGNTGTAKGQAGISFKILRQWNGKTETDGCVQVITLPGGNAFSCAELNSVPIIALPILYVGLWELCLLGGLVGAVSVSGCQFWCEVLWDPFHHMRELFFLGFCVVYMEYIFSIFSRNVSIT